MHTFFYFSRILKKGSAEDKEFQYVENVKLPFMLPEIYAFTFYIFNSMLELGTVMTQ